MNRKTHREWRCDHCDWTYASPILIAAMWHRCPARNGNRRFLKAAS
jgi:hypothetical protein